MIPNNMLKNFGTKKIKLTSSLLDGLRLVAGVELKYPRKI